jgi:Flp pilus assembly protein TadB
MLSALKATIVFMTICIILIFSFIIIVVNSPALVLITNIILGLIVVFLIVIAMQLGKVLKFIDSLPSSSH